MKNETIVVLCNKVQIGDEAQRNTILQFMEQYPLWVSDEQPYNPCELCFGYCGEVGQVIGMCKPS